MIFTSQAYLKMSEKTSDELPVSEILRLQAVTMRFSSSKLPSSRNAGAKFLVEPSELESTRKPYVRRYKLRLIRS